MINAFRRSAYLFLSGLMGLLMFFILHRIAVFFYLFFATYGDVEFKYSSFLFWDYTTLVIILIIGVFYGMWVGKYWYVSVYHAKTNDGLVGVINSWLWGLGSNKENLEKINTYKNKIEHVTLKLEEDLEQLETIVNDAPIIAKPVKILKSTRVKSLAKTVKKVKTTSPKVRKTRRVKKVKTV